MAIRRVDNLRHVNQSERFRDDDSLPGVINHGSDQSRPTPADVVEKGD